jgi:hypothetical protein
VGTWTAPTAPGEERAVFSALGVTEADPVELPFVAVAARFIIGTKYLPAAKPMPDAARIKRITGSLKENIVRIQASQVFLPAAMLRGDLSLWGVRPA